MTQTQTLLGHDVNFAVPEGWSVDANEHRVRIHRELEAGLPPAVIHLIVVEGSPRETLDDQIAECARVLTDFTVLHAEPQSTDSGNWETAHPEPLPFVFTTFRQGIYTLSLEIAVLGAGSGRCLVGTSSCLIEETEATERLFTDTLGAVAVRW